MSLYIQENKKFNALFRRYVADEDLLIYSIDESILDVTHSLALFIPDDSLTRQEKRQKLAERIQEEARTELGLIFQ